MTYDYAGAIFYCLVPAAGRLQFSYATWHCFKSNFPATTAPRNPPS
jgi:hypothetical protein